MTGDRKAIVQIASLWERTSKAGNVYYSGFMGSAQLLMFRGEKITRDNGDVVQTWNLLVQERQQQDQRQQPATRTAQKGQGTWDRSRHRERHAQRAKAQQAGEAVLAAAGRRDRGFVPSRDNSEPPADWLDDSAEAIRDLERGPGR